MAWRYLFARKSHSAVSTIAVVSVCGVALATMATICVLSVFNGFQSIVDDRGQRLSPQLIVTRSDDALIPNADSLAEVLTLLPEVKVATPVVEADAVAGREGIQLPIKIIGVDSELYPLTNAIKQTLTNGSNWLETEVETTQNPTAAEPESEAENSSGYDEGLLVNADPISLDLDSEAEENLPALLSIGAAQQLEMLEGEGQIFLSDIDIFLPRRTATTISTSNPAASFMMQTFRTAGVFESQESELDMATVFLPISQARELLEYDSQGSSIYVATNADIEATKAKILNALGSEYTVKNRLEQNSLHLRMISIEKYVTFLLLSFILIIASFNLISTLSMLIVEKRKDLVTLSRIGASRRMIGAVFCWESAYVCAGGTLVGLIIGIALCLIQQATGIIAIGGDTAHMYVTAYPVVVQFTDVLLVLIPSFAIAMITATVSSRFALRQLREQS